MKNLTPIHPRPTGGHGGRQILFMMDVAALAALVRRHGQRLRQLRNRNMQGLCAGLAGLVLHERSLAW